MQGVQMSGPSLAYTDTTLPGLTTFYYRVAACASGAPESCSARSVASDPVTTSLSRHLPGP